MPVQVKAIFPTAAGGMTTGLSPVIEARRSDSDAIQDTGTGIMTEVGATGIYTYTHTDGAGTSYDPDLEWYYPIDGTSSAPNQVRRQIAFIPKDTLDNVEQRIISDATPFPGADVPAIKARVDLLETEASAATRATTNQTEHDATQANIAALNDFDPAATPVEILDAGGAVGTSAAELVVDVEAKLALDHGVGQWDSTATGIVADVQTGLTNQGYTTARASNLDNLDALVSSLARGGAIGVNVVDNSPLAISVTDPDEIAVNVVECTVP